MNSYTNTLLNTVISIVHSVFLERSLLVPHMLIQQYLPKLFQTLSTPFLLLCPLDVILNFDRAISKLHCSCSWGNCSIVYFDTCLDSEWSWKLYLLSFQCVPAGRFGAKSDGDLVFQILPTFIKSIEPSEQRSLNIMLPPPYFTLVMVISCADLYQTFVFGIVVENDLNPLRTFLLNETFAHWDSTDP